MRVMIRLHLGRGFLEAHLSRYTQEQQAAAGALYRCVSTPLPRFRTVL